MTETQYREALQNHDWYYDYSDDYTAWCRGRDELSALQAARRTLDPDYSIWNEYAPKPIIATTKTETSK